MKGLFKNRPYLKMAAVFFVAVFIAYASLATSSDAASKRKVSPIIDPSNPNSVLYLDTAGKMAGTGDATKPVSEAYKAGRSWHPQALSAASLPKDRYGLIDWVKLVDENIIAPRPSLDPDATDNPPLDMDVEIETKGYFVDNVKYPHSVHTYWFDCTACHPGIFTPARGSNNMTMVGISRGEWCGRCHGKVAFPLTDCAKCHSIKKTKT